MNKENILSAYILDVDTPDCNKIIDSDIYYAILKAMEKYAQEQVRITLLENNIKTN